MKWSPILHLFTVVAAAAGFLALLGAWLAGEAGEFAGFSQEHLFNDAQTLLLLAISLGIGVLIHRDQEKG